MIKQSDIAIVILVAGFTLFLSYFLGGKIINTPDSRTTEIEKVVEVSAEFPLPDSKIFSSNSLNPTELIQIGGSNTEQPFDTSN